MARLDNGTPTSARTIISEAVQWRLLETVLQQTGALVVGSLFYIAVAAIVWMRTGQATILWIAPAAIVLLARVWLDIAFQRDRRRFNRRVWTHFYTVGSCAMAFLWGLATLHVHAHRNHFLELIVITSQIAFLYATANRVSALPRVATLQVLITSTMMIAIYTAGHNRDSIIIVLFLAINIVPNLQIVRDLHRNLLLSLGADEEMTRLATVSERANRELEAANNRLGTMAATDELTSIANRRRLDDVLAAEWRRAERGQSPISLYIADIDRFKQYNDSFGHQAGDECLRRVAQALSRALRRPGDVVGRYGGEEFVAILPGTESNGAQEIAERARAAIEELHLSHPASDYGQVTVSIGVTTSRASPPARAQDMVRFADQALYRAKETGRNRVCVAS